MQIHTQIYEGNSSHPLAHISNSQNSHGWDGLNPEAGKSMYASTEGCRNPTTGTVAAAFGVSTAGSCTQERTQTF